MLRSAIGVAFCSGAGWAQVSGDNIITTLAGTAWTFPDGVTGRDAPLGEVAQPLFDRNGNVIFADPGNDIVCRLNGDGTVSVIAGNGIRGFTGDGGPARSASLNQPATPPNVKNPVSVTIGDAKAAVSLATLVAGYTGMYQVRIAVPDGVATGDAIPLVVSVLGQSSVPVNSAVR